MLYCSACKRHHNNNMFGTKQRRKAASVRVCMKPVIVSILWRPSIPSDYADYIEFGRKMYYTTEYYESEYEREYGSE